MPTIFSKPVPTTLKRSNGETDTQCVVVTLRAVDSAGVDRSYVLELTQNDDALFYHQLQIDADTFAALRHEQNLLVSIDGFGQMFADLIDAIVSGAKPHEQRLALHLAQQNDGSMKLEIVEMNRFKHLVHLTLLCARPTEEQLRRHLAALINNLKDQLRNSELNCQRIKDEHSKGQKALEERNAQYERLKQHYKDEIRKQKEQHDSAIKECEQKSRDYCERMRSEMRDAVSRAEQLQRDLNDLRAEYDDMHASGARLAAANEELERRCFELEEQSEQMHSVNLRVESLERELQRAQDENVRAHRDVTELKRHLHAMGRRCEDLERQLVQQKEETEKGVDVLRKVMSKSAELREEVDSYSEKVEQMQRKLTECEEQLKQTKEELEKCQKERQNVEQEKAKVTQQIRPLQEEVARLNKETKGKDTFIAYLNRTLTELRLQRNTPLAMPAMPPPQPSSAPLAPPPVHGILRNSNRLNVPAPPTSTVSGTPLPKGPYSTSSLMPSMTSTPVVGAPRVRFNTPSEPSPILRHNR